MLEINIQVSEDNEGTEAPWWIIIDPGQVMKPSIDAVAGMVTGPFFSREEAENYLAAKRYYFGEKATVYCHTGHHSRQYKEAVRRARDEAQP